MRVDGSLTAEFHQPSLLPQQNKKEKAMLQSHKVFTATIVQADLSCPNDALPSGTLAGCTNMGRKRVAFGLSARSTQAGRMAEHPLRLRVGPGGRRDAAASARVRS